MYCEKLENIISNKESAKYQVTNSIINQFDYFVKNHLTYFELRNINPIKFSQKMKVDFETSMMFFIIGTREKLFQMRAFFYCECGTQHEIKNLNTIVDCECDRDFKPSLYRERVFLYFNLLENPEPCNSFSDSKKYQTDYLGLDEYMGKEYTSLADLDTFIGYKSSNQLFVNQSREEIFKKFLEEGN